MAASVRESAASISGLSELDSSSDGRLRSTRMRPASYATTGPIRRTSETSGTSDDHPTSMSLLAASHAHQSAVLASGAGNSMDGGSGPTSHESFAWFDPATWSLRTSQGSWMEESPTYLGIWPKAGSMRSGRLFRRAQWVHHICGTACSLWPTPREVMSRIRARIVDGRRSHMNLEEAVAERGPVPLGYLNPRWVEWLMGFPLGWCAIPSQPSVTRSSPRSPRRSVE